MSILGGLFTVVVTATVCTLAIVTLCCAWPAIEYLWHMLKGEDDGR